MMATTLPTTLISCSTILNSSMKTKSKVSHIEGLNSFGGLKAHNSIATLGLPTCTNHSFHNIVTSLKKTKSQGKKTGGGALTSTCNASAEIFKIAAIMNGLVLIGVAVGFILLRIEAWVEETEGNWKQKKQNMQFYLISVFMPLHSCSCHFICLYCSIEFLKVFHIERIQSTEHDFDDKLDDLGIHSIMSLSMRLQSQSTRANNKPRWVLINSLISKLWQDWKSNEKFSAFNLISMCYVDGFWHAEKSCQLKKAITSEEISSKPTTSGKFQPRPRLR